MDESGGKGGKGGGKQPTSAGGGAGEAPAPLPPCFGNANAQAGDECKGINLDDVFCGVFFSPEGDLLDIPSDGDDSLNLTLSSTYISEGTNNPQFAQFAVLGEVTTAGAAAAGRGAAGDGGAGGDGGELMKPLRDSSHQLQDLLQSCGGGEMVTDDSAQPSKIGGSAETIGGVAVVGGLPLPTGGVFGPLAPHGVLPVPKMSTATTTATTATTTPASSASSASLLQRGGGGISAATTGGGISVAWGRGSYSGKGASAAPRRQRHKVSSKDLTEEQRIERRERNREHAKRSRVRKKFLLDSLQQSVDAIQAENDSLKGCIVGSLGERGRELVATCVPPDTSGQGILVTANNKQATKILDDPDYSLVKALQTAQQNFVITDASLPDNPIVFASNGFLELTRYKLNEVLGRNCRFLQGPETDPRAVDKIRKAIEEGYDTSVCLLNYRADGTTFWNQFFVASLRDGKGDIVNYVGVQCKVGDDYAKIVVNEQNRQLSAAPGSGGRREG